MKSTLFSRSGAIICFIFFSVFAARVSAQTYCTPSYFQGCVFGNEINDFFLTGESPTAINDPATGCPTGTGGFGGYENRTGETVTLLPGHTYTVSVDDGGLTAITAGTDNFQLWIDFNNDGTFDASESVGGGALPLGTGALTSFTITIPAGVSTGSRRMRGAVSPTETYPAVNPCPSYSILGGGTSLQGEVHDYTAIIGTASASCGVPTGLAATGVTSTSAILNWSEPTGSVGSEYVVTTTPGTPTGSGTQTTALTYSPTGLTPSTVYYASVRDSCGPGSLSAWVTITFTTTATTSSCGIPTGLAATGVTSTSAVLNWSEPGGSVGSEYVVTTTPGTPTGSGTQTTALTHTATGLTPSTVYYASVRDSCGPTSLSAWVTITFTTSATVCAPVTGITMSAITSTSATLTWTAVPGSVGYSWVVDNSVTAPTGGGTFTTLTTANATGLTAGTAYYAHVRDSCGPGSVSGWVTVPFATLTVGGCNAVTSLTVTGITATSGVVNWTRATGAIGAEYVVNTTAADPVGAGTGTTASTHTATGLTAATLYYAHVRDSCGATSLSVWLTVPFTTSSPTGFNNVPTGNFALTAFPNPVKDEVTIKIDGTTSGTEQVQLIDISGKLIKADQTDTNTLNMSMAGLPAGIYLIRYTDAEHTQTIKVIKQ